MIHLFSHLFFNPFVFYLHDSFNFMSFLRDSFSSTSFHIHFLSIHFLHIYFYMQFSFSHVMIFFACDYFFHVMPPITFRTSRGYLRSRAISQHNTFSYIFNTCNNTGEKHDHKWNVCAFFSGREVNVWSCVCWQSRIEHFHIFRCGRWKCATARANSCKTEQASNWHDLSLCVISITRKTRGIWKWTECTAKKKKKNQTTFIMLWILAILKSVVELQFSHSCTIRKGNKWKCASFVWI